MTKFLWLGPVHSIKELEVTTLLTLNTQKDYLEGDNSDIVATGTLGLDFSLIAVNFLTFVQTPRKTPSTSWPRSMALSPVRISRFFWANTSSRRTVMSKRLWSPLKRSCGIVSRTVTKQAISGSTTTRSSILQSVLGTPRCRCLVKVIEWIFSFKLAHDTFCSTSRQIPRRYQRN